MAETRKIALVGSVRIPFARAYGGYSNETNLSMLGTVLAGLKEKYGLEGHTIGEVMGLPLWRVIELLAHDPAHMDLGPSRLALRVRSSQP